MEISCTASNIGRLNISPLGLRLLEFTGCCFCGWVEFSWGKDFASGPSNLLGLIDADLLKPLIIHLRRWSKTDIYNVLPHWKFASLQFLRPKHKSLLSQVFLSRKRDCCIIIEQLCGSGKRRGILPTKTRSGTKNSPFTRELLHHDMKLSSLSLIKQN